MPATHSALLGLLVRRERWGLSWRGVVVTFVIGIAALFFALEYVHGFLAVTRKVESDVLVVEGWIVDYALQESWEEFSRGNYKLLLTTGAMNRSSVDAEAGDTYAEMAARRIRKRFATAGAEIQAVPCGWEDRDRTYTSAVALATWLRTNRPDTHSINIVTHGPHARRTRLMYEMALGSDFRVGIISVVNREYNPAHWWRYSEGIKDVVSESAAYAYARLFFSPN